MLGTALFIIVLLVYGFILSRSVILKMLPEASEGGFKGFMVKFDQFFDNKGTAFIFSFSAFVIGLWNFFAPDFGMQSPSIIGALIPSLAMILDSAVMYPEIIEVVNIEKEKKDKYYTFVEKISGFMGILTVILAFVHMIVRLAWPNMILF